MTASDRRAEVLRTDQPARMAKASVRFSDPDVLRRELGACIEAVRHESRLTLDEFAHALGKDPSQVGRWISGEDRPQIETVLAVERFQPLMVVALAGLSKQIEVVTEIRVRRSA